MRGGGGGFMPPCPLPCMPPCHACPPAMHAPSATHASCHACPPVMHAPLPHTPPPCMPTPTMHAPPAMHIPPTMHTYPCHACHPLPFTPPLRHRSMSGQYASYWNAFLFHRAHTGNIVCIHATVVSELNFPFICGHWLVRVEGGLSLVHTYH